MPTIRSLQAWSLGRSALILLPELRKALARRRARGEPWAHIQQAIELALAYVAAARTGER